jgi:hypothetical protein
MKISTSIKSTGLLRDFIFHQMESIANNTLDPSKGNAIANLASKAMRVISLDENKAKKLNNKNITKFIEGV